MKCPFCGRSLQNGTSFCKYCGSALRSTGQPAPQFVQPQPALLCPRCGTPLQAGSRFCKRCGAGIAAPAAAPSQGPAAFRYAQQIPSAQPSRPQDPAAPTYRQQVPPVSGYGQPPVYGQQLSPAAPYPMPQQPLPAQPRKSWTWLRVILILLCVGLLTVAALFAPAKIKERLGKSSGESGSAWSGSAERPAEDAEARAARLRDEYAQIDAEAEAGLYDQTEALEPYPDDDYEWFNGDPAGWVEVTEGGDAS